VYRAIYIYIYIFIVLVYDMRARILISASLKLETWISAETFSSGQFVDIFQGTLCLYLYIHIS